MFGIKQVIRLTGVAIILAAPAALRADQPQTMTISTDLNPVFVNGKLRGCSIEFEVGRNDPEYSKGKLVDIQGSLSLLAFDAQSPYFLLKLAVTEAGQSAPQAPTDAYLLHGYATNRADFVKRLAGEAGQTPGSAMFFFRSGKSTQKAALDDVILNRTLTFGYAMQSGGLNAVVPVDLRIRQVDFNDADKSQIDDKLVGEWSNCAVSLLDAAKNTLQDK